MPHKDPERHKQYHKEYSKRYWQAHKDRRKRVGRKQPKEYALQRKFKITLADYEQLQASQDNVCAICGCPEAIILATGKRKSLAVDHDHKTGKIRGLLCSLCNTALGLLREDSIRIIGMLRYIQEHTDA